MSEFSIPSMERYEMHLRATGEWLLQSIRHGSGGSCATYTPILGWSRPYPETTGYLIPTLVKMSTALNEPEYGRQAELLGQWLLKIQETDGSWHGGLYPNPHGSSSVFNTGQILKGLVVLYRLTKDVQYENAMIRAAAWLASGVRGNGYWPPGDYTAHRTPAYYTEVTWPMLEVWKETGDDSLRGAAVLFLNNVVEQLQKNGVIADWGFNEGRPAFTHTIAYTLRGLQESARLLNDYDGYGLVTEKALEIIGRKAELTGGRLPGEFNNDWKSDNRYVCLTGNAQIAICLLILEKRNPDLRLVNMAAKLVDYIGKAQRLRLVPPGIKGGVAGSSPVWGRYMVFRYPNWAAKYYCDALMRLSARFQDLSNL